MSSLPVKHVMGLALPSHAILFGQSFWSVFNHGLEKRDGLKSY